MAENKNLNRIKVALAEKAKNKQVACRAAGCQSCYCKQMVYKLITALT